MNEEEVVRRIDAQYAETHARLAASDPEYVRLKAAADAEARLYPGSYFARNHLAIYVEAQMPLFPPVPRERSIDDAVTEFPPVSAASVHVDHPLIVEPMKRHPLYSFVVALVSLGAIVTLLFIGVVAGAFVGVR